MDAARPDRSPPSPQVPRPPSSAGALASPRLQQALEMGETVGRFLHALTGSRLSGQAHLKLAEDVAAAGARAAYAGLGLWAVCSLTPGGERGKAAAEAIAGFGLGLLSQRSSSPSLN